VSERRSTDVDDELDVDPLDLPSLAFKEHLQPAVSSLHSSQSPSYINTSSPNIMTQDPRTPRREEIGQYED
jgi:hypothetical protein